MKDNNVNKKKIIIIVSGIVVLILGIMTFILLMPKGSNKTADTTLTTTTSTLATETASHIEDTTSEIASIEVATTTPTPQSAITTTTDNTNIDELNSRIAQLENEVGAMQSEEITSEQEYVEPAVHIRDEDRNIELRIGETREIEIELVGIDSKMPAEYKASPHTNLSIKNQSQGKATLVITARTRFTGLNSDNEEQYPIYEDVSFNFMGYAFVEISVAIVG